MPTGKVKWFSAAKGFGFITPECVNRILYSVKSAKFEFNEKGETRW